MNHGQGQKLKANLTHVKVLEEYRDHMLAFHQLSLRANVRNAMERLEDLTLPRNAPDEFITGANSQNSPFHSMQVAEVSETPLLTNVSISSTNTSIWNDVFVRMKSSTLCLVQVLKPRQGVPRARTNHTRYMFGVIRSTQVEGVQEVGFDADTTELNSIIIKFALSCFVLRADRFTIEHGKMLHFLPICLLASDMRVFRAIYELYRLPWIFRNVLFGRFFL